MRSGLAERRNPVLVRLGVLLTACAASLFRDPLALFLLLASIGLAVTFALLLGSIKPSSSGKEVPLTTVQKLAKKHQTRDGRAARSRRRASRSDDRGPPRPR